MKVEGIYDDTVGRSGKFKIYKEPVVICPKCFRISKKSVMEDKKLRQRCVFCGLKYLGVEGE